jgi:hypothetical protein
MSEKEKYEKPITHRGSIEQNEGLLSLVKDNYYDKYPENTTHWIVGEVARQLKEGEYITYEDWRVDFLLDPSIKTKQFNSKEKMYLLLIQEEVAKYVMKSALSDDPEKNDRYRYFFGLPTRWQEVEPEGKASDRVYFATKTLEYLTRQGIDNTELKEKLFNEIFVEYGFEKVYNNESITDYVKEVYRTVRHFTESEFFEVEEYREVVREYIYKTLKQLYADREIDELIYEDDSIHNDLDSVLHQRWIWNGYSESQFIEDEEFQDILVKIDTEIKRRNLEKSYVESSLDVIADNINGFSTKIFERRFENVKIAMQDIFVSLEDLEKSRSKDDYELLYEKYARLSEWYCEEYSYVLEDVIGEITGIGGDYNQKALLPELKKLFVRVEWGNSIENVLKSYSNFKYLLELNGGLTT